MKKQLLFIAALVGATNSLNAQDVTTGLVAKYNCENDVLDAVGGFNGFYTAGVTFGNGLNGVGYALEFDGYDGMDPSSTIDEAGVEAGLIDVGSDFTISFWIRRSPWTAYPLNILSSRRNIFGQEAGGVEFVINNEGKVKAAGRSVSTVGGSPSLNYAIGNTVLQDYLWYHLVLTQNGSTGEVKLYVNGSTDDQTTAAGPSTNFANAWAFGHSFNGSELEREFNGLLDEIRFYDRALSSTEVSQLFSYEMTLSADEIITNDKQMIYPNPTSNSFKIEGENVENVKVFDVNGSLVKEFGAEDSFDINHLESGIYIVNVVTSSGLTTHRLIKE
jgi:hypothetical protein